MSRQSRLILISLTLILVSIVLIFFIFRNRGGRRVELAEVVRGDITSVISAPGVVRPLTQVQISSSVVGRIDSLPVKEGERVDKGQLLILLDQTEYQAQVRRARANLDLTEASLAQSKALFKRSQELYNSKLISEQEYEAARTQFLLDQARVKESRATYAQALEQLEDTRITAPISGTVTQLNVELGENVIPGTLNNPGTVLMVIADLSRMQIECEVDEADIASIRKGQRVAVEVEALSGRQFRGSVMDIGYAAASDREDFPREDATVSYAVDILIMDSVDILKPGMTANVQIVTEEVKDVLIVPLQVVVVRPVGQFPGMQADGSSEDLDGDGEMEGVFVYDNGVARLLPVKTGVTGEDYIQITGGLQEGQQVISGPFEVLRELDEGEAVRPE